MKTRRKIIAGVAALAALALGGAAIAGATQGGGSDEGVQHLTGNSAQQAREAALRATGGGTANAVERDSEKGATYEVEVTKKDGSTVDVRLDGSYKVVAIDGDSESEKADDQAGERDKNEAGEPAESPGG